MTDDREPDAITTAIDRVARRHWESAGHRFDTGCVVCMGLQDARDTASRVLQQRNIRDVIKQIIPLIPANLPDDQADDDFIELRQELESCAGDWFSAPEIEMPLWIGLATTLEQWLDSPKRDWPEWKWQVLAIFSGPVFSRRLVMDSLPEETTT